MSDKIVVAQIIKIEKHPDARKLQICQVDDGSGVATQVVCGASNVKEGMLTILAKPGATLPNGVQIKEAKLRGIDSFGMLCSPLDLKIKEERGLIDLEKETPLGLNYLQLNSEQLSSTPWYLFKHVDSHWLVEGKVKITRGESINSAPANSKLISKTYFDGENYQYRSFNEAF